MPDRINAIIDALTSEGRGLNFWALLGAMALWVFTQSAHSKTIHRAAEATVSMVLTWALAPELAEVSGRSLLFVATICMAVGHIALGKMRDVVNDSAFIRRALERVLGLGSDK